MTRIHSFTQNDIPARFEDDVLYFELFSNTVSEAIPIGLPLPSKLRKYRIVPTVFAMDFAAFALSVVATDKAVSRADTADGWTRKVDLTVSLCDPASWTVQKGNLEKMLRYLTGDFWSLTFLPVDSPMKKQRRKPVQVENDCVCLLSGGVDSLVGAIDLVAEGSNPLFVSQIVRGDAEHQKQFAAALGTDNHFQWSAGKLAREEGSTRARSIMFFAFAALSACALKASGERVRIVVPENGFISLNTPLDTNRIGSLSTKTTHPVYMAMLQEIWDAIGINAELVLPYKYKTKGEVLKECRNQALLKQLVFDSNSCGKYQRHNLQQCGVCVPCLVRRAAFLEAGLRDVTTKGYVNENLKRSDSHDLVAVALAVKQVELQGVERFIKSSLSFANGEERRELLSVVSRGIAELNNLLRSYEVI
jgi:hypothetical protein